jgi:hypothetical protein
MIEVPELEGGVQREDANAMPIVLRSKVPHIVIIDNEENEEDALTVKIPLRYFRCSLTNQLTANPVLLNECIYDEAAIQQHLKAHDYVDPLGNRVARDRPLTPDMFRKNLYTQVIEAVDEGINDDAVTLTIGADDMTCPISFDDILVPYCIPNAPHVYKRSEILGHAQRQIQPQMEANRVLLQQFEDAVEAGVVAHIQQHPFEVIDREQVQAEVRARLLAGRPAEAQQPVTCTNPSTNTPFQVEDLYIDKLRLAIGMAKFKNTKELLEEQGAAIRANLMDCITFAIYDGDKALVDKLLTLLTQEELNLLRPQDDLNLAIPQEGLEHLRDILALSAVFVGDLRPLDALNYNALKMNPLMLRYALMARKDRIFSALLTRPGNWSWVLNYLIDSLTTAINEKNDLMLDFIWSQVFISEAFHRRVLVGDNIQRFRDSLAQLPPGSARFFTEFMGLNLDNFQRSQLFNFVNKALIIAVTERNSKFLGFIWTRILCSNPFRKHIPAALEPLLLLREIVTREFPEGALMMYQAPETQALLRAPAEIGFLTACRNADNVLVAWCLERDPNLMNAPDTLKAAYDIASITGNKALASMFLAWAKSAPRNPSSQALLHVDIEKALANGQDYRDPNVRMFIENVDFNWGQLYGAGQETIFHLCCAQRNTLMLEWLLSNIPPDQQRVLALRNRRGNTALSGALNNRHECASILIRAGAGVFLLDPDERSPLMQAEAQKNFVLVAELKQFYTANVGLIADMLIQQNPWLVDNTTYKLNMPLVKDWVYLKPAILAYLKAKELGGVNTIPLLKKIRTHISTPNSALRQFFNLKESSWGLSRADPISKWSADLQALDAALLKKIQGVSQLSAGHQNDNNKK